MEIWSASLDFNWSQVTHFLIEMDLNIYHLTVPKLPQAPDINSPF